MLRRQFARIQRQNCKVFDAYIEDLISRLRSASGMIDLQPYFFRFTLAIITALLFRGSVSTLPREETDSFEKAFNYVSSISALRLRLTD